MTADFNVILNFNSAKPVLTGAQFKAGDKGFAINMDVRELDPTGMTPKIAFYRSNGTSVESGAVTNVGNIYSYTLLGNELAVPGVVVADLKFYDGDDQRVSSASFIFTAISDTLDGLGGGTESYSDELEQLSAEFQDTLDDYIDAFGNTAPINPRGDYDNTATYEPRDMVYDPNTGTSWVAKVQTTGHAPASPSAYWQKLVNSSGSSSLGDLVDVDTTGATAGQLLGLGNNNEWVPVNAPAGTFSGLSDVDMTGVLDGQVPAYNSNSGKYEPITPSSGGVTSFNSRAGDVSPTFGDYSADQISYDNTDSGLLATDAEAALNELASEKTDKADLTSIIASGETNATGSTITAGTYFYLNNVLVKALADIASGASFTLNTNYENVTAGALNDLIKVTDYTSQLVKDNTYLGSTSTASVTMYGKIAVMSIDINVTSTMPALTPIVSNVPLPMANVRTFCRNGVEVTLYSSTGILSNNAQMPTGWTGMTVAYIAK